MEHNGVKEMIRSRGLTYDDLAEVIGITAQAVSEIVDGRTTGATARYALARALGTQVDELWPQTVERPSGPDPGQRLRPAP